MTLLPRPTRADGSWRSSIAWGGSPGWLSPDHPCLTSGVFSEGRSWCRGAAGSRSRVRTLGTGVWPAQSQLRLLMEAMVGGFRADFGGGSYDLGEGVIPPSHLPPDLGDFARLGSGDPQTALLRMDNKPSTPYQHPRIPPLTRQ